jgi:hypothetical protein
MQKITKELTSMEENLVKGQKEMTNVMAKLFVFTKKISATYSTYKHD